jgi:O-antigen/teichoic acid export membrane protein
MYLFIAMPIEVLHAVGHFMAWNLLRLCPMFLWAGIFLVAWLAGVRRAEPIAFSYIVLGWLIIVPAFLLLRRQRLSLIIPRHPELKDTLKFGLPAVCTFMPRMLNLRLDQILMAGVLPPMALGQYVVAVAWSGAGAPLVNGVAAVIVPKLASQEGRDTGSVRALTRATRVGVLIAVLTAFGLCVLASLGIRVLFGARFSPAVPAARLLAIAGGVAGLNMILSEGMRGFGRPASVLRAELVALVFTVTGLWLTLRPMGIYGAALVSLLAYSVTACWLLAEVQLVTQVSTSEFLVPRRDDLMLLVKAVRETALSSIVAARIGLRYLHPLSKGRLDEQRESCAGDHDASSATCANNGNKPWLPHWK